jgi:hypothetical protein
LKIGWEYATKVISEIHLHHEMIDLAEIRLHRNIKRGVGINLTPKEDFFFFPIPE